MTGKELIELIKHLGIEDWELDFGMGCDISFNNPKHEWGKAEIGDIQSIDISSRDLKCRPYVFIGIDKDGDTIYDWLSPIKFEEEE